MELCKEVKNITVRCEACNNCFTFPTEEEQTLFDNKGMIIEKTHTIRRRYICDECRQNNWKFTEHGVLMNETPVKKRVKK